MLHNKKNTELHHYPFNICIYTLQKKYMKRRLTKNSKNQRQVQCFTSFTQDLS